MPDNLYDACNIVRYLFRSNKGNFRAKNFCDITYFYRVSGNYYFRENLIPIDKVISSEWCRCKETAQIAFKRFETKDFLNSFFSEKFSKNRTKQIKDLNKYIDKWDSSKNLILVTHYVVITEVLNYAPSSGEIVISNIKLKKKGNIEIKY